MLNGTLNANLLILLCYCYLLLGHLTNFCTNFYEFFLILENSLHFAKLFCWCNEFSIYGSIYHYLRQGWPKTHHLIAFWECGCLMLWWHYSWPPVSMHGLKVNTFAWCFCFECPPWNSSMPHVPT